MSQCRVLKNECKRYNLNDNQEIVRVYFGVLSVIIYFRWFDVM